MKNTSAVKLLSSWFGKLLWIFISSGLFITSESFSQAFEWISSTEHSPWVEQKPLTLSATRDSAPYDLEINTGE
jgi:hypothetical protein